MTIANHLDITLLGREYRIACAPEQQPALLESVTLLDGKMQEIASKGKHVSAERAAIMAALNLAHDLLQQRNSSVGTNGGTSDAAVDSTEAKRKVSAMVERVNDAITAHQEVLF